MEAAGRFLEGIFVLKVSELHGKRTARILKG
jgi:hypothetical protein